MADAATPVVNWTRLLALRELQIPDEPDVVRRVIDLFVQETPHRLGRLNAALGRGESTAIAREAHAIRGAAGMIGAERVFRAARALEDAANGGAQDDLVQLAAALERTIAAAQVVLLRGH